MAMAQKDWATWIWIVNPSGPPLGYDPYLLSAMYTVGTKGEWTQSYSKPMPSYAHPFRHNQIQTHQNLATGTRRPGVANPSAWAAQKGRRAREFTVEKSLGSAHWAL